MSTTDVPGTIHGDRLTEGCWAEHPDGSLLHVLQQEGGRVVYDVFDLSRPSVVRYVDAMPIESFNRAYSWRPADPVSVRWVWHDKTGFPWERVLDHVAGHETDNIETVAAEPTEILMPEVRSVAAQLAARLQLVGEELSPEELSRLGGRRVRSVLHRLNAALQELRP